MASVVYMIQAVDGGPIKIGSTRNLPLRLRDLSLGGHGKLVVLATIPGNRYVELDLHERFSASREKTRAQCGHEWFEPTQDLVDYIRSIGGEPVGPISTRRFQHPPMKCPSDGRRLLWGYLRDNDMEMVTFCKPIGMGKVTFSSIINGDVRPRLDTAEKFEAASGGAVPVDAWTTLGGVNVVERLIGKRGTRIYRRLDLTTPESR